MGISVVCLTTTPYPLNPKPSFWNPQPYPVTETRNIPIEEAFKGLGVLPQRRLLRLLLGQLKL